MDKVQRIMTTTQSFQALKIICSLKAGGSSSSSSSSSTQSKGLPHLTTLEEAYAGALFKRLDLDADGRWGRSVSSAP